MSTTLYAANLPLSATESTLEIKFAKFGVVLSVRLPHGTAVGTTRRHAFVEMQTGDDAQRAINALNLAEYDGRLMSVYRAVNGLAAAAKRRE